MFFPGSRYGSMATYQVARPDGTLVRAVKLPLPGPALVLGYHGRLACQRLDLIAAHYLTDATAFWRLCDANNAMVPDALGAADLVGIPLGAAVTS
jgi:hypothetical protein